MDDATVVDEVVAVMDDLVEEVCWYLLAGSRVGRIAFVLDGEPWVLPINFRCFGEAIVFRTSRDSMLHSLTAGAKVAVEIDHVDVAAQTGWSVIVRGEAVEITQDHDLAALVGSAVHPWAPGERDVWVRVVPSAISGRSISRGSRRW